MPFNSIFSDLTTLAGNLSSQPIPFVIPVAIPVVRPVNPTISDLAIPNIAAALQIGQIPSITVPAPAALRSPNATINFNSSATSNFSDNINTVLPPQRSLINIRPTGLPNTIEINPSDLPFHRRSNDEILSLSRLQIGNNPSKSNGLSQLRPEIIGMMDYEPIYFDTSRNLNDVGLLMNIQYQARHLREQTLLQILNEIKNNDPGNQLQLIQTEFSNKFNTLNSAAEFFQNTINTLDTLKEGFDIKTISNNSFNLAKFRTLRNFYEAFLLFPRELFDNFSNTKILMQLLYDLRAISENYSMNLLSLSDPDRRLGNDSSANNPIGIDKTYTASNGFTFTYDTIRSWNSAVNAAEESFFTQYNSALPSVIDDRIKVILTMLSKELRVSRALGLPEIQRTLRDKFGASTTDGSPFDNIIGGIGNTILEPVLGPGSLAGLLVVNDSDNSAVLPFETKYIDVNNDRKSYIPGSVFFIDSIVGGTDLTGKFDTKPLKNYVDKYIETVDSAGDVLSKIFDYGINPSTVSPVGIFKKLLDGIVNGLQNLGSNVQLSATEGAVSAIFKLSASDRNLKLMVFQYFLLRILTNPTQSRFFSTGIAQDLEGDIRNLNYLTFNDGDSLPDLTDPNSLIDYRDRIANTIQDKISLLINQQLIQNGGVQAQTRTREQNRADGKIVVGFDTDVSSGVPFALNRSVFLNGLENFISGLEGTLGNDINIILDGTKRTRYNSLSISTMVLLAFEIYSSLLNRYTSSSFQFSEIGSNIPDMIIDIFFNDRSLIALRSIISDPELGLPINEPPQGISVDTNGSFIVNQEDGLFNVPERESSYQHTQIQAVQTNGLINPGDLEAGVLANSAIVSGRYATAGDRFTEIQDLILRQVTETTNPQLLLDAQTVDQSLNSLSTKIFQDDFAIACGIHILLVIKKKLKNTLDLALNYFTDQTLNVFSDLNLTSVKDIGKNLTSAQVRLLIKQRDSYLRDLKPSGTGNLQIIPTSPTDPQINNALMSLLAKYPYREGPGFAYRILNVGLPAGFSKILIEKINGNNITSTSFRQKKAFELFYINVYKRSLEYPEIIFKPQKFLFDLSLFTSGYKNLDILPTDEFDTILEKINLLDYQILRNPLVTTLDDVKNGEKYSIIPDINARYYMFLNHVLSDLFISYQRSLTTMDLSEDTFVDQSSFTYQNLSLQITWRDLTPRFAELARNYLIQKRLLDMRRNPTLSELPNISIQDMLNSSTVDQSTKDILQLLNFGNVVFRLENAMASLLSPKLFDRVFSIPLNLDKFEIDYKKTTGSQNGRDFINKEFIQKKLDKTAPEGVYRFKPRTSNDIIFEDFFITAETLE